MSLRIYIQLYELADWETYTQMHTKNYDSDNELNNNNNNKTVE